MPKYVNLKDLKTMTPVKFVKKFWRRFDEATNKFEMSDDYKEGYSIRYQLELDDQSSLSISQDQFGQMLVATFSGDKSVINGHTFSVKTNGKTGKDIRYFINLAQKQQVDPEEINF